VRTACEFQPKRNVPSSHREQTNMPERKKETKTSRSPRQRGAHAYWRTTVKKSANMPFVIHFFSPFTT